MTETLRLPALQVQVVRDPDGGGAGLPDVGDAPAWSTSSTPTLRRKRSKMRRMKNVLSEKEAAGDGLLRRAGSGSASKEYLQLPLHRNHALQRRGRRLVQLLHP
ncbi:hypothetical protein SKAU_G00089280 [Synaphobranchus kaupii]|uniref:Uncharacterized protein n=1 Tax=Synaphobranchus kaupii TaxID=118154 RepID=A0A9Q1FWD2_SYNKA|nr:hypothetical protein SKAU_G00089280 [Synaphobranchus kaupii]